MKAEAGLLLVLIWTWMPGACAETFEDENWPRWNAASKPLYPAKQWLKYQTPEDAGWSLDGLNKARKASRSAGSAAVMIIYNGAILAEWGETERRFKCHSIRKSLLSALYGTAVSEGRVKLGTTIGSLGIDDHAGLTPLEKSASIADLLKSRSGIYLPAAFQTPSPNSVKPQRGSHRPGSYWYYNNWDFNVLGAIYNQQTGRDLFRDFSTRIARPLQMQDFDLRHTHYAYQPDISRYPAYAFRMSARDLARFGLLFLNQGRWRQNRIIPAEWVQDSTKGYSVTPAGSYGYMWWREVGRLEHLGTFTAYGWGGQAVYVVPGAKLVVVHRTDTYAGRKVRFSSMRKILRLILSARRGPARDILLLPTGKPALPTGPDISVRPATKPPRKTESISLVSGQYRRGVITLTVRRTGGRFEIESPRQGRFYLQPRGASEYVMEDSLWRVKFKLTGNEAAAKLHVRLWPGQKSYEFVRVP